jgi:hypothetical protein
VRMDRCPCPPEPGRSRRAHPRSYDKGFNGRPIRSI